MLCPSENTTIIGHQSTLHILAEGGSTGHLPQSLLLSGPRGIGKATLAYRFIRCALSSSWNSDLSHHTPSPTHSKIVAKSHPDLLVIGNDEEQKDIKVDDIRKIGQFFRLTSSETGKRIVLIDGADRLNINSANALLKALEEPPQGAMLIMIAHNAGRMLPTILSRCHHIRMQQLSTNDTLQVISGHEYDPELVDWAVSMSPGSPGQAMELLSPEYRDIYQQFVDCIISQSPAEKLKFVEQYSTKTNAALWPFISFLIQAFLVRTIRLNSTGKSNTNLLPSEEAAINYLCNKYTLEKLINIWEKIQRLFDDERNINMDRKVVLLSTMQFL